MKKVEKVKKGDKMAKFRKKVKKSDEQQKR